MSEPLKTTSRLQSIWAMVAALLISALIAVAFLTDVPAKFGLGQAANADSQTDDHEGHDHNHGSHDEYDHGDHEEHDHASHDHASHDHAIDDRGGHAHDTLGDDDEASLPPMFLEEDQVVVLTNPKDHAAHDHSSRDHSSHDHSSHDHSSHDHSSHNHAADDHSDHAHDTHAHDDHGHEGHSEENAITLSSQARKNLRLNIQPVTTGVYTRYVDIPGVVADWPGRTHIDVTSPLTGVINAIEVTRGQLIAGDKPLFTLRLTHQDLVKTQESFLSQLGQRDVEDREVKRLAAVASTGAVAKKTLIERSYVRDKLLATIRAARQSLLLHGLTERQVQHIEDERELIREVLVRAPEIHEDDSLHHDAIKHSHSHLAGGSHDHSDHAHDDTGHPLHKPSDFLVTALDVNRGQAVAAGERLTQLSDYSELLIEGHAFQSDSDLIRQAANAKLPLKATLDSTGGEPTVIEGLQIITIGSEIEHETRTLPFFVSLKNELERIESRGQRRFASWKYKPGQRLRVQIPTKQIEDVIVLPVDAIAQEGAERYVFAENAGHFDRVPVTILQQDATHAAIAKNGQLKLGQRVVLNGAHDLQMAMRNKSGAGVDPHAGHTH